MNVGTSLFLNEPDYTDFCNYTKSIPLETYDNITKEICEENNGTWNPQNVPCEKMPCPQGYCDFYTKCQAEYERATKPYDQKRFYLFSVVGFILLLVGLFARENLFQITGLATGGILVIQSIVFNLQNKLAVFLTLLGILIIFGVLAWRVVNSKR